MNTSIEKDLRKELLNSIMPGRYLGGEYGSIKKINSNYNIALCFPDLYEIGMSNQAIKILYNLINNQTEASCERVFAPAPDFEKILREKSIELFTLESGKSIKKADMLAFTIGYELSATNILNILDLSNIPLLNKDRNENDPIIIAGGPAITNPVPFGDFLDLVYIGEAEDVFSSLINELIGMKNSGCGRLDQIKKMKESPYIWYSGKKSVTKKAIWSGFADENKVDSFTNPIIPSISVVQDHGVVEIMRGCPNGCRFCHAGILYRPYREKPLKQILSEIDNLVYNCGYREITLSSLSSGDFSFIKELISLLNKRYSNEKISFSFPSMRVNSLTLPLLSEISKVRKSGLTFAVETPELEKQRGLNKEAPIDKIIEILNEAKKQGWNKAKFYFMLGLPFYKDDDETDLIIDFLRKVGRETRMFLNVNIGTFIPKPHTPFQWSFQLNEEEAFNKIKKIRNALPSKFFKVGYQSPFMSFLEGIISRGDAKAGKLILSAFKKGARFDAWEEYINKDIWQEVINKAEWDVAREINSPKLIEEELPWDSINMNVSKGFLKKEWEKTFSAKLTNACTAECEDKCGACDNKNKVRLNKVVENIDFFHKEDEINTLDKVKIAEDYHKILFSFEKKGKAEFLSHINIMTIFERAFLRSGLKADYSGGFNPKPKLEFASPLSLGFSSEEEFASVEMYFKKAYSKDEIEKLFVEKLVANLPDGLRIIKAKVINKLLSVETGKKVKSLMASYYGSIFQIKTENAKVQHELLQNILKTPEIHLIEENFKDTNIRVKIVNDNGKILNLFKFLKEDLKIENPFDYFQICRLHTFAENEENYFTYYN